jgi:hypothetical protein
MRSGRFFLLRTRRVELFYFLHWSKSNNGSTCSRATMSYSSPTKSSRSKNSPIHSGFLLAIRFAFPLILVFYSVSCHMLRPIVSCYCPKQVVRAVRTVLSDKMITYSKWLLNIQYPKVYVYIMQGTWGWNDATGWFPIRDDFKSRKNSTKTALKTSFCIAENQPARQETSKYGIQVWRLERTEHVMNKISHRLNLFPPCPLLLAHCPLLPAPCSLPLAPCSLLHAPCPLPFWHESSAPLTFLIQIDPWDKEL